MSNPTSSDEKSSIKILGPYLPNRPHVRVKSYFQKSVGWKIIIIIVLASFPESFQQEIYEEMDISQCHPIPLTYISFLYFSVKDPRHLSHCHRIPPSISECISSLARLLCCEVSLTTQKLAPNYLKFSIGCFFNEICWSWRFQNTPYMSILTKFWLRYLSLKTHDWNLLFLW